MVGVRFVIAGLLLYVPLRLRGAVAPTSQQWRAAAVIGAFLLLGGNGGVSWAEQYVPSGMTALIVATVPLFVVLIDWSRPKGPRPTARVVIGLSTGFAGVFFLVNPTAGADSGVYLPAVLVLVAAAVSWALGSVLSRYWHAHESAFVDTAMKMIMGGAMLTLAGTIRGEWSLLDPGAISLKSALALVYLIVFGAIVGFSAFIWLLKNAPLSKTSTYAYVNPVVAVILGWWLGGEELTLRIVGGAAVIVAGVVVITLEGATRGSGQRAP